MIGPGPNACIGGGIIGGIIMAEGGRLGDQFDALWPIHCISCC